MVMWESIEHALSGAVIIYLIVEVWRVRRRLDRALLDQERIRMGLQVEFCTPGCPDRCSGYPDHKEQGA